MHYNSLGTVKYVLADDTIKLHQSDPKNLRPHDVELDNSASLNTLMNDSIFVKFKQNKTTLQEINEEMKSTLLCIRIHATNKHAANRTACVRHFRSMILGLQEEDYQMLATRELGMVCENNNTMCADQRYLFMDIIGGRGDPFSQKLLLRYLSINGTSNEKEACRILLLFIHLENPLPELILKVENLCFGKDNEFHAKSAPFLHKRKKRSVTEVDSPRLNHIVTKLVFINSLGNTGMERSLDHILSYLQPNQGASAWRRAAVLSLRHYKCNKSANALLHTALYDEHDLVKEISLKAFSQHPRGRILQPEHHEMVLTRNYSYPALMRLKRGIIDIDLTGGFRIAITIPGINWEKTIGSSDIGAGFGLNIRNRMELELKPLQGHFLIDTYNKAFVEAYCGLLNKHVDIFKALVCFQGHIGYDLNVLKDFGINNVKDLVNIFDTIMKNTVDPIKKAVNNFKHMVQTFRDGGIQKMFNSLVLAVKNLPQVIKSAADKFVALMRKVADFGGLPWLDDMKRLVVRVKTFIEDVRDDIMGFYNTVVDAVTVTLPYIGKQFMDSIATIVSATKSLLSNPSQAINGMTQAIMNIKMAISMFLDVKNQVLDACFFLKGKTPYWMTIGDEVNNIITEVKELIDRLSSPGSDGILGSTSDLLTMAVSDGIQHMEEQAHVIKAELIEDFKDAMGPLMTLFEVAKPVIDTFRSIMDVVQGIKSTYEFLRDMIIKAKSMIQKIFGPKFNIKFPTRRREENAQCGQGVWPTTTAGLYKTTGVDVHLNRGSKVRCPVNGMVYKKSSTRLLIEPSDADFVQFEIVLDNVEPDRFVSSYGTYFTAGKTIGKAGRSNCSPNFIHVAMRQKTGGVVLPDEEYNYVDPSPYLDRLVPIPQWIEECNEMTLIVMNQVIEVEALAKDGADKEIEEVESSIEDDDINEMDPTKEPNYIPDNVDSSSSQNVGSDFLNGMKNSLSSFSDLKNMFSGESMKVPNILDIIDLKQYIPLCSSEGCHRHVHQILNWLLILEHCCPTFRDGLNKGFGHVCQAHENCLGLSCGLMLPYGSVFKMVSVDISVRPCDSKLHIAVNTDNNDISLDGHDYHIPLMTLGSLSAELIVNADVIDNAIVLSAEATICHEEYLSCLVRTKITTDITFPKVDVCDDSSTDGRRKDVPTSEIEKMTLGDMILAISQNDIMTLNDMELIGKIRDAVVSELFKNPKGLLQILGEEFQDKMDFCIDADIPIDPWDITFFEFSQTFPVGPVPLFLGFGAGGSLSLDINLGVCFLSMSARVTVTPGAGASVWGTAGISLGFARGGIRLVGYLLETKFPITGSIGFSKFPLDVTAKMDLILIPLKLDLKGVVVLCLPNKSVTIFDASIWSYTTPTIKHNIFTTPVIGKDSSPPEFPPNSVTSRRKREGPKGCLLEQVKFRSPLDAAFKLEVSTLDETSQVKLFYAIGTQRGGTNVVDWTEMGGASLLVPTNDLPSGIPLYWTVKARNTQGLEAYSYCMLPTYDTTVPDGRIDPSFEFSSHPNKISGTVVVFDDSILEPFHEKAVGFTSGQYGSEFVTWDSLDIDKTTIRDEINDELKYFSVPRDGKLTAQNFKTAKTRTAVECAKLCLEYSIKCVSFDYEYHSEICDMHEVVEGPRASLRLSGTFKNYERLGVGHSSYILYENLPLQHATVYYINAKVTNAMGYTAYITSVGTTVDFTPPSPGHLGPAAQVTMEASQCSAAVTQRCVEVTWKENHKVIVDDEESSTVFNGLKPLQDEIYTINNHIASVNFDGFHDDESGISGYTWMVGQTVCTQDIVEESDPHKHHSSEKYWTHNGYEKNLHLQDGPYYVTVRALNNIVFGGALVTTVCHSTPFTVDTTAPIFTKVLDIFYDEDFDLLAVYFNASDPLSHLARVDFGLGKTKHDVTIRGYELQTYVTREEPFVAVEHLGLGHGVPAWLRLRAVNNVGLHTARHGDEQILIDLTPPNVGVVLDGDKLDTDIDYQFDTSTICAEWVRFYDEESGIRDYIWGVGTAKGADDIVKFHNLTHHFKRSCAGDLALKHNTTYYSTVNAYNAALNSKSSNGTSDGILIDITPPLPGIIWDGPVKGNDIDFSSETATKSCNWDNFTDPESHIAKYDISLYINREHIQTFEVVDLTQFTERSITMNHRDEVEFIVTAENGAGKTVDVTSNGFLVDHTPPVMDYIHDTETGTHYQSFIDYLDVSWLFKDEDSNIKEYRYFINKQHQGSKHKSWPVNATYQITDTSMNDGPVKLKIDQLKLVNGAKYSIVVTAINNALLSTSHESFGVTVDGTSPILTKVHIGLPKEDEEVDELDRILHVDPSILTVSWVGQDPESGIDRVYLGIGTSQGDISITGEFLEFDGSEKILTVNNLALETFSETNRIYYVSIKVTNGAGMVSNIVSSKPIIVLKANIPGQVSDGRQESVDEDYTVDRSSLAVTFAGFESEACNIIKYEWAIGSDAYMSDVLPYTGYGLMVHNSSHGQAQIHMDLTEGKTYYVTVRAHPGHNCHEEYIVSSSDGIKLDTSPPEINYIGPELDDTHYVHHDNVFYQSYVDSLDIVWNVSDHSDIKMMSLSAGSLPYMTDVIATEIVDSNGTPVGFLSPKAGESTFLTLRSEDRAGNNKLISTDPVIADISAPTIRSLECTEAVSTERSLIACSWEFVVEEESVIKSLTIKVISPYNNLKIERSIPHGRREVIIDVNDFLNETNTKEISLHMTISNVLNQNTTYVRTVIVDATPPSSAIVKVVTQMSSKEITIHQRCQIPQTYVNVLVENPADEETGIERIEVAIGTTPGHSDVTDYVDVPSSGKVFLGNLDLGHGKIIYATAMVTNIAGLSKMFYSDSVTVSVLPLLTVGDGGPEADDDYQSNLNTIRGFWRFSDTCPIDRVQWKIEDLMGNDIKDFEDVVQNAKTFYNDEFSLKNGFTYINIIKVRDALNRTFMSASDGITVRIEPPNPADVRDGLNDDINYQQSVNEISANWDEFGDDTGNPTQTIRHYEVALGDDHRFPKTRSNIYYYVNVGLNQSHTFRNLNLTSEDVTYYVTVRATSVAGSQEEAFSNGIKVGFENQIYPGLLETPVVQSDVSKIVASWTEFQSDIGIRQYLVGVFGNQVQFNCTHNENETFPCETFYNSFGLFDEKPMSTYGLDTLVEISNLHLKHGHFYFVSVLAVSEADMCRLVTSSPILIDTTPPDAASVLLHVGNVADDRKDDIFVDNTDILEVAWENFTEYESSIDTFEVTLYQMTDCKSKTVSPEFKVDSVLVTGDTKATMYQLSLFPKVFYFLEVTALNTAGLTSSIISSRFRLDQSAPFIGDVKIAPNWFTTSTFQSSKETITAWIGISRSHEVFVCANQRVSFPVQLSNAISWEKMTGSYNPEFVEFTNTKAKLIIGYNTAQTKFMRSGMKSTPIPVLPGNYTVSLKAARGINVISIISFGSESQLFPKNYTPPHRTTIGGVIFNMTLQEEVSEIEINSSTTQIPMISTTTFSSSTFITENPTPSDQNFTGENYAQLPNPGQFGFGLSIIGTQQNGSNHWDAMFWVAGQVKNSEEWITLDADPSESEGIFTFALETESKRGEVKHNIKLIVNGITKANAFGVTFGDSMKTILSTWNDNEYEPAIENIFEPFRSEMVVTNVLIPTDKDKLCLHGAGFYDGESSIKEIWVGVTDNDNCTDSISPMQLYQTLCLPCEFECLEDCSETCQYEEFDLIRIDITGLKLLPTLASAINGSEYEFQIEQSHTYYVTIEAVNFAGQKSTSRSNAIMVDTSHAVCEYVRCLDPENSMEEPTEYIGSNNTVAAYWSCLDAESEVYSYSVGIGSSPDTTDIYNMSDIGLATKSQIFLTNGNTFNHGSMYYFNVWAYNAAGSPGKFSCKFNVELYPPDVENVTTKSLFEYHPADVRGDHIVNVSFTELEDSVGVAWNSIEDVADIYEWGIGTSANKFDILPMIKVGVSKAGQAEIVQGHVWFNRINMNSTVSSFRDQPNDTIEGSLFLLEPGRCLHHSLVAVGRSHLKSSIPISPTCITRPTDSRLSLNESGKAILTIMANGSILRFNSGSEMPDDSNVLIEMQARRSGIMIGQLSNDDVTKNYGTDATDEFSPSIVDPKSTIKYTSRLLKNRLQDYKGLSFVVSPMPQIEAADFEITISIKIDPMDYDNDTVPALALWNNMDNGYGKWLHVQEECNPKSISNLENQTYLTTQVCHQTVINKGLDENARRKRDVSTDLAILTSPYQFGLFQMRRGCVNTEPTIITNVIHTLEDTPVVRHKLLWNDAENDTLIFSGKKPRSGQLVITNDGYLTFVPPEEFSGQIEIVVEAEETTICNNPHSLSKIITVHITNVDDPPLIGFLSHDNNFTLADHLDAEIIIFLEGNNTELFAGSLLMADPDMRDSLRLISRRLLPTDAELVEEESGDPVVPNNTFTPIQSTTYKRTDFKLKTDVDFHGHLHYQMVGMDKGGQMTARIDVHLFVLISPCNYGRCAQTDIEANPCNDSVRAVSFDGYSCVCDAGYRSQWCNEEIDECADDPCPPLFDCTDHVASYTCDINGGYLAGVLLSTCVVVIAVCILIVYRYKKYKKNSIHDSSMWRLDDNEKWTQRSTRQLHPSIGSTSAILLHSNLVPNTSTADHTDPQQDTPLLDSNPFESEPRPMEPLKSETTPLNLDLDK
ncbi:uncharacterized protein LOC132554093 [Ylistrum balloti]|uniref:uncharacterized protein LOC132554093 n=1 Tax=Ylistrum balloti TaxID=509963 RepID=UPI002905E18C|nr:uncharacterized protein LOC132554093 [Ylistrum balloti]